MKKIFLLLFLILIARISFGQTYQEPTNTSCFSAIKLSAHDITFNIDDRNSNKVCQHTPFTLWYYFVEDQITCEFFVKITNCQIQNMRLYGPFPSSMSLNSISQTIVSNPSNSLYNYVTPPITDSLAGGGGPMQINATYVLMVQPTCCYLSMHIKTNAKSWKGITSDDVPCEACLTSYSPTPGKKYVVSAWAKEEGADATINNYVNPKIYIEFPPLSNTYTVGPFFAKGEIVDGWQRIEESFTIPSTATKIKFRLESASGNVFYDDIRVFPVDGMTESYVYDPISLKLVAKLDEENYATLYEYDEEGKLVRVKKETTRGIMTVEEARRNAPKR